MSKAPDWDETVILRRLNEPDEMMALIEAVRRVIDDGLNTAFIAFLDLKGRRGAMTVWQP